MNLNSQFNSTYLCHLLYNERRFSEPIDRDDVDLILLHDHYVRGHRDEPQESTQNVKPQNVENFIWNVA